MEKTYESQTFEEFASKVESDYPDIVFDKKLMDIAFKVACSRTPIVVKYMHDKMKRRVSTPSQREF